MQTHLRGAANGTRKKKTENSNSTDMAGQKDAEKTLLAKTKYSIVGYVLY